MEVDAGNVFFVWRGATTTPSISTLAPEAVLVMRNFLAAARTDLQAAGTRHRENSEREAIRAPGRMNKTYDIVS